MTFSPETTGVFVIGGGPAGLAVAIAAAGKGFSVTVADGAEPPIDKACGEGMMPATLAVLRELGVELPAGAGCRLRGIRFVEKDIEIAAEFPEGPGIGIRRTFLHSLLIQKAEECGAELLWKTPVVGIEGERVICRTERFARIGSSARMAPNRGCGAGAGWIPQSPDRTAWRIADTTACSPGRNSRKFTGDLAYKRT